MTTDLMLIFPERRMDELSEHLCALTKAISARDPGLVAQGFLGGEFGYGAAWENDVFAMRPFCWCEGEDCPWCAGCKCSPGTTEHFIDGRKVPQEEYWNWFIGYAGPYPYEVHEYGTPEHDAYEEQWHRKLDERNARSHTVHHPDCDHCLGRGMFARHGGSPGMGAPNFWHKPSGLKVWWYKWIGRDMKAEGDPADLDALFAECISSISPKEAGE